MPFAQLLPSRKVLWESDRDIRKSWTKRGRGHEEIAIHTCNMNSLHNMQPLFFSFTGIAMIGTCSEFHQNGLDKIGYSVFISGYFLKHNMKKFLVRWRPVDISLCRATVFIFCWENQVWYKWEKNYTWKNTLQWCFHQRNYFKSWLRWLERHGYHSYYTWSFPPWRTPTSIKVVRSNLFYHWFHGCLYNSFPP